MLHPAPTIKLRIIGRWKALAIPDVVTGAHARITAKEMSVTWRYIGTVWPTGIVPGHIDMVPLATELHKIPDMVH